MQRLIFLCFYLNVTLNEADSRLLKAEVIPTPRSVLRTGFSDMKKSLGE